MAAPDEPVAVTADEQDHEDPWRYASDEYVDAPADTGRAPEGDA